MRIKIFVLKNIKIVSGAIKIYIFIYIKKHSLKAKSEVTIFFLFNNIIYYLTSQTCLKTITESKNE